MEKLNKYGTIDVGNATYSYEVLHMTNSEEKSIFDESLFKSDNLMFPNIVRVKNFNIATYGGQNDYPERTKNAARYNWAIPEHIKKRVAYLYGQGPALFKDEYAGNKVVRTLVKSKSVNNWLDSWKANGIKDNARVYLMKNCFENAYVEGVWSKFRFSKSRRIGGTLPVTGLESVSAINARLATKKNVTPGQMLDSSDFPYVAVGRWDMFRRQEYSVFRKHDEANPFAFQSTINYSKTYTFGEELYSFNTFLDGLSNWIKTSNLTPSYANSFLRNSLNARLHIIIPEAWVNDKEEKLREACEKNKELKAESKEIIKEFEGIEIGIDYTPVLLFKLIKAKVKQFTNVMSGEGKNQGKTFETIRYRTENGDLDEWEFKEIPMKSKEFIESLIKLDEQASSNIIASLGIDSAISNVDRKGILSKSGSDAYYQYLLHIGTQYIPEMIVTYDINLALKYNFPKLYTEGCRIGFIRYIPEKQEDVPPGERLGENV